MCNMHMDARLFTGKEKQAVLPVANNGGCHEVTVANFASGWHVRLHLPSNPPARSQR